MILSISSLKYFNPEIKNAYKEIETTAGNRLVSMLPDDFKDDMDKIIKMNGAGDDELKKYVKAADKFSALIKCIEEIIEKKIFSDFLLRGGFYAEQNFAKISNTKTIRFACVSYINYNRNSGNINIGS